MGATLFFSCENDIEKVNLYVDKAKLPEQSAENVEIVYTEDAEPKLRLKAKIFERFKDEKKTYINFPEGIYVTFYTKNREIQSTLKANRAIYYESEKLWEAHEDVVAVNEDGDILNTELLYWDENTEKIYSDKHVRIRTKDEILFGEGFESNQEFTKYKIKKLTGTVSLADE
ncbi:MAG: LPS export ABC transporter periplasmic protein LptC [Bacteroidetes bacterium GWF2_33_38]|nr:MAG: LPS export ABC transporter periplasmic protein LptC [Bacteroidetes bacterium GWF2_33_38]